MTQEFEPIRGKKPPHSLLDVDTTSRGGGGGHHIHIVFKSCLSSSVSIFDYIQVCLHFLHDSLAIILNVTFALREDQGIT